MTDANADIGWLRRMTAADLQVVLVLRNHPEIRRYMLTRHEISSEEHLAWYQRAMQNPGIELLVFELNGTCCGFVQFKETSFQGVVDWGFYTDPESTAGTGRKLGRAALRHAFEKDKLHKICGQAFHWNHPSIEFHKSLGFVQEGVLRDHHFDGVTYHGLVSFGILKHEWADNCLPKGRIE
jgi:UDP-4-amino-4,6-dideoxy-N-acetyl-beta-L-altrosamine N-acetyltransferase